jgi:hypothetical protein
MVSLNLAGFSETRNFGYLGIVVVEFIAGLELRFFGCYFDGQV